MNAITAISAIKFQSTIHFLLYIKHRPHQAVFRRRRHKRRPNRCLRTPSDVRKLPCNTGFELANLAVGVHGPVENPADRAKMIAVPVVIRALESPVLPAPMHLATATVKAPWSTVPTVKQPRAPFQPLLFTVGQHVHLQAFSRSRPLSRRTELLLSVILAR